MPNLTTNPSRFKDAKGHVNHDDKSKVIYSKDQSTQIHPKTRTIYVFASDLEPNKRYYLTLNGKDVRDLITPCEFIHHDVEENLGFVSDPKLLKESMQKGSPTVSSSKGALFAKVEMPGDLTVVGSHRFEISWKENAPMGSSYIQSNRAFDVEFEDPNAVVTKPQPFKRVSIVKPNTGRQLPPKPPRKPRNRSR